MFYDVYSALCKEKGISESKAAEEIGLNRSTVNKWKKGATPKSQILQRIAEYFGVEMYDLIDGGFGALDAVLPPNMQGVNLDGAKVDSQFLSVLLENLSHLDRTSAGYVRARNNIYALAVSSGLSDMARDYITKLEGLPFQKQNRQISDKDLMFALWGDTSEVDEADLADVKAYAKFVRERKKNK